MEAAIIVLLTIAAYSPALRGGFIWDDDAYVTGNVTLREPDGLWHIWVDIGATPQYYPLVHTSFWIEYRLWGLDPLGYHATNLLLHVIASVLLWRLLVILELPGAWFGAAIFAVHPVHVESVAWITERKNVLSAVFYFAAAIAYLRFDRGREGAHAGRWGWYAAALALFAAALGSKTVTCSLPAAVLLVLWWKRGAVRLSDVIPALPFFALGAAASFVTGWLERVHVGAVGSDWDLTFLERCLIAGRALWFYVAKLLWPVELTFIYPRWLPDTGVWWQWLFPLSALATGMALWLSRRRLGRGPLVATLFFAGTLLPALGFINTFPMRYSFVADHFQYLASVGLIALAAAFLSRLPRVFGAVVLLVLAFLTWQRSHAYRDIETIWLDTLAKNPGCWLALGNLGKVHDDRGEPAVALDYYQQAARLKPDSAEVLNNVAAAQLHLGDLNGALANVREAIRLDPNDPRSLSNHATILIRLGRSQEALEPLRAVIRLDPTDSRALSNYGAILMNLGRSQEAIEPLRAAIRLDPTDPRALSNYGGVLITLGRTEEAIAPLRAALERKPDNVFALSNLGVALAAKQQWSEAERYYQRSLALDPNNRVTQFNLEMTRAHILAEQGRRAEALAHARQASHLDPVDPNARQLVETLSALPPQ